jgi:outer membrane protein TolC
LISALAAFAALAGGLAQSPVTLREAVAASVKHYAGAQVPEEEIQRATAGIRLARTAFLPSANLHAQVNRGTRNNVFGMLLPNSFIAPISGPPRPENDLGSAWGTATGLLFDWEPFDFGLRQANVRAAQLSVKRAEAAKARTDFEIAAMAADAFLTLLAAEKTVEGARAGVIRAAALEEVVSALANAELRPGADVSRVKAERAVAEVSLIQAEAAVRSARAVLKQLTGVESAQPIMSIPSAPGAAGAVHPRIAESEAEAAEAASRRKALDFVWRPQFHLIAATYARGTGVTPEGILLGGANGLGPNIVNYGVGLGVSFPLLERPRIQARQAEESARVRQAEARQKQTQQDLAATLDRAQAALDAARRIAAQTPIQLDASKAALDQATARYKAGLGTIAEVAEAQRLVTQAETDQALANLAIWRAALQVAAAQGDLEPVLAAAN